MFCPECRAEYRSGFKTCSDCGVDLVEHLDHAPLVPDPHFKPKGSQNPNLFLALSDEQYFQTVLDVLDELRIPHEQQSKSSSIIPGLGGEQFFIFVKPEYRDEARRAVERSQEQFAIPAEDGDDADVSLADDVVPGDFNPNDATVEVWHGDDLELHDMLVTCLNGVGIGCATHLESEVNDVADDAGATSSAPPVSDTAAAAGSMGNPIFVRPADEKRAREVIREIVDASPPQ